MLTLLAVTIAPAQGQFKLMSYNLLEFPEAPPDNRELLLNDILAEADPDILLVQELQSPLGADLITDHSFNYTTKNMQAASFVFNTSGGTNLNQLLYYNADKLKLLTTDQIATSLRDINYYKLRLQTVSMNTSPVDIHVFIAHLKASQGDANEEWRFNMVQQFTNYLSSLPADARVILGGDMNFYSGNENGVQQLVSGNSPIPLVDPLNQIGNWHTNSSFADIHTQSTRQSNSPFNDFGAGGGLDDRFDFIFLSANLLDDTQAVYYQDGSYETLGNSGNCYNSAIAASICGGNSDQLFRNNLYNMSDHLPVLVTLNTTQDLLSIQDHRLSKSITFPRGNVASEYLSLHFSEQLINDRETLLIYNSMGKQIKNMNTSDERLQINVSGWVAGVYYLKLATFSDAIKFIVN